MSIYRQVDRAGRARQLDRGTWAENTVALMVLDIEGSGEQLTDLLSFGVVFDGPPSFSYGVELIEGQSLVPSDFPFVTCGVSTWETMQFEEATDGRGADYYIGAYLWVNVSSSTQYRLRFRFAFEGVAFKNPGRLTGNA